MTCPTNPKTTVAARGGGSTETSPPSTVQRPHKVGSQLTRPQIPHARSANARGNPQGMDFGLVNAAALLTLPALLGRWLPEGKVEGKEFVARNPRRTDRNRGSFKINLRTGRWADFATGDRGGDPISLAAYLFGLSQIEAARKLAHMLGLPTGEARHD